MAIDSSLSANLLALLNQLSIGSGTLVLCQISSFQCRLMVPFSLSRGDSHIEEDDRTYVRVQETPQRTFLVVLELNDVVESDAGLYKIRAKNKFGEVAASINLNFSRKPSSGIILVLYQPHGLTFLFSAMDAPTMP